MENLIFKIHPGLPQYEELLEVFKGLDEYVIENCDTFRVKDGKLLLKPRFFGGKPELTINQCKSLTVSQYNNPLDIRIGIIKIYRRIYNVSLVDAKKKVEELIEGGATIQFYLGE